MNVSVNVPEELYRRDTLQKLQRTTDALHANGAQEFLLFPAALRGLCAEVATAENISVDDLFASAFEERLLEFERLKEKASRGSYQKFLHVMSKIPSVEPPEHDRL